MKTSTISVPCCFFAAIFFNVFAYSQNTILTTEGTDFWFTFMPNYHNYESSNRWGDGKIYYAQGDSLHVYISSKTPNKGTIYYYENNYYDDGSSSTPAPKSINWNITTTNSVFQVAIPYSAALRGSTNYVSRWGSFDAETVTVKSFHVIADSDCSVYALDYAEKSAEAFIVLPTAVLGKEYIINTYNTHQPPGNDGTPSQFAVVAPNDNTSITIIPSDRTKLNNINQQQITLNKGEVYLVQADNKRNLSDMTGSQVIADKEIAVFAGHQRASIPKEYNRNPSRDCLIEQMLPVNTWGKNVIITPFTKTKNPSGNPSVDTLPGIYRVVAATDNTNIFENDSLVATINKGEFYEGTLKATMISSENQIMVTTFMPTAMHSNSSSYTATASGDPSMIAIPPTEQYKTDINIMNAQIKQSGNRIMFREQFVTVIVPDVAKNTVTIDNVVQHDSIFIPIGDTKYSYANIAVKDGQHHIDALLPIGVIIYGYGEHVSYGYLGGMTFFDFHNQEQLKATKCFESATWTYHEPYNSAITSYKITNQYNCNITEQSYNKWQLILKINKTDVNDIAHFSVKIFNIHGDSTICYPDTMQVYNLAHSYDTDNIDFGQQQIGSLSKISFKLTNTGTLPIQIDKQNIQLSNNTNFTIGKSDIAQTLQPNDSNIVDVFYAPTSIVSTSYNNTRTDFDTLTITSQCDTFQFILSGTPTEHASSSAGSCSVPIRIISDSVIIARSLPTITPVPASDGNCVYSFSLTLDENISINIYDVNGNWIKEIASTFLKSGSYELPIETDNLPNGVYFIELKTNADFEYSKFLIEK